MGTTLTNLSFAVFDGDENEMDFSSDWFIDSVNSNTTTGYIADWAINTGNNSSASNHKQQLMYLLS